MTYVEKIFQNFEFNKFNSISKHDAICCSFKCINPFSDVKCWSYSEKRGKNIKHFDT